MNDFRVYADENHLHYKNNIYIAEETNSPCNNCAFHLLGPCKDLFGELPKCTPSIRKDKKWIVWKEQRTDKYFLKIGDVFELHAKRYIVTESEKGTCRDCAFSGISKLCSTNNRPYCGKYGGNNLKFIVFKEIQDKEQSLENGLVTPLPQIFEEPVRNADLPIGAVFTKNGNMYSINTAINGCKGCVFYRDGEGCRDAPQCASTTRKDATDVVFKKLLKVTSISAETTGKLDAGETCASNDNELIYDGRKYIAKSVYYTVPVCEGCGGATFNINGNKECIFARNGIFPHCTPVSRKDGQRVVFVEKEKIINNNNQKTNNMKNYIEKIKSLILPSTNNDFVFTMDGKLGLRKDDKIVSYDKTTNEFTEYPSDFGIEIPVFEISTPSNQIKEGDVIKHNNSWCIVKSIKDNNISVLSYTGTSKKVQVVNNFLLGQKIVRKIMSFDIQGNNNNNMNPMMMLALMDGKDGNDTVKTMLMMQMMQNNNKGFNPMMMLMLDKSIDMKDLLMMNMMGGMQMPFFDNSSDSSASK